MWSSALDSDVIKFFVELVTWVIKIIDKIGLLNSALITIATIAMIKSKTGPIQFFTELFNGMQKAPGKIKDFVKGFLGISTVTSNASKDIENLAMSVSSFQETLARSGMDAGKQKDVLSYLGLDGANSDFKINKETFNADKLVDLTNSGTIDKSMADKLASVYGLTDAYKELSAEQMNNVLANVQLDDAQKQNLISTLGIADGSKLVTNQKAIEAINSLGVSDATKAEIMAKLGLTNTNYSLATSFKALWTAMWPVLAITAAFAAIVAIVSNFNEIMSAIGADWAVSIDHVREEISDLKSELSDLESDMEGINSELETTRDRMAELIAMPSLSFVEQEELEALKEQTKELERQLEIKKVLAEATQEKLNADLATYIDKVWNSNGFDKAYTVDYFTGEIVDDVWYKAGVDTKDAIAYAQSKYVKQQKALNVSKNILSNWDDYDWLDKRSAYYSLVGASGGTVNGWESVTFDEKDFANAITDLESTMAQVRGSIYKVFGDENFKDLKYGMSEQIDQFLDTWNDEFIKSSIILGDYTASDAINRIINIGDEKTQKLSEDIAKITSDSALEGAEKTAKINELISQSVDSTSESYNKRLATSLTSVFGSLEKGTGILQNYYNMMSQFPDSSTVEGITQQYQAGVDALNTYSKAQKDVNAVIATYTDIITGEQEKITWDSLFDKETGEVLDDRIAMVLKGADETARNEFARIAKAVNDGKMEVENAIKSFGLSGTLAGFKLVEQSITELNTDVFKNLGDDISGLIDTFEELGSVLESVSSSMDLVSQAEAEQAYSGSVSLETALKLMQTTDDWNKVLTITEGSISVNEDATENLVKDQLNLVVANLKTSLSTVSAQIAQNNMAASSDNLGKTIEESTTESVRQLAANMEYLGSLVSDFLSMNWIGMNDRAKAAKAASLESTKVAETPKSTVDLGEQQANLVAQLNMMGITATIDENGNVTYDGEVDWEKLMSGYSSDDASGGNGTKDDAEKSLVEEGWEKLINKYENELALITNERDLIQAEIDKTESRGGKASEEYYEDLIRSSTEEKNLLEAKKKELEEYLRLNKDNIDPETWTEYNNEINETAVAIKECEQNVIEYADAIREIDTHYFEKTIEQISRLGEEIDFVMSLFEDEDVANEDGSWTEAGITKINLLRDQMTLAAATAQEYSNQIAKLNTMRETGITEEAYDDFADYYTAMYEAGKITVDEYENTLSQLSKALADGTMSEEMYTEMLNELVDGQRDAILSGKDARDNLIELNEARIDAIESGIEKEIEAYEDLIDVQKEELQASRDLYDFKNKIKNQTKSIAELERRIASLSGSNAASDVAERRRLEAELMKQKESLNDDYMEHSRSAQDAALDDEAEAFANSKEKYLESLREAANDTETIINDMLLNGVFNADVANEFLTNIQETYGVPLSKELTDPWKEAADQATAFKNSVGIIAGTDIPPYVVTLSDKIISELGLGSAKDPWGKAINAAKTYSDFLTGKEFTIPNSTLSTFGQEINSIVSYWNQVKNAANDAYEAQQRTLTVKGNPSANTSGSGNNSSGSSSGGTSGTSQSTQATQKQLDNAILTKYKLTSAQVLALGYGPLSLSEFENLLRNYQIKYSSLYKQVANTRDVERSLKKVMYGEYVSGPLAIRQYAKGTTGTARDEWAITDEFGPELILHADPTTGRLQYLTKGSGVIPSELTEELMELGKIGVDGLMNTNKFGANINMISNAINKPEIVIDVENFLKVDRVDKDTLPQLEAMMDKKIDMFAKQLNYSIKKFSR